MATVLLSALKDTQQVTEDIPVGHAGTFSYNADVRPSPAYPDGRLRMGQPVFFNEVEAMTFSFDYRFQTNAPHDLTGTIQVNSVLREPSSGWSAITTVMPATPFRGDATTIRWNANPATFPALLSAFESSTGTHSPRYNTELVVLVQLSGTVAGEPYSGTFVPSLPGEIRMPSHMHVVQPPRIFSETDGGVFLSQFPDTEDPGNYLSKAVHPSESGVVRLPVIGVNNFKFLGYRLEVPALRTTAFVAATALAVLVTALLVLTFLASQSDPTRLLLAKYSRRLMPVADLSLQPNERLVSVGRFDDLLQIAGTVDGRVLHVQEGERHQFLVRDGIAAYRFDVEPPKLAAPDEAAMVRPAEHRETVKTSPDSTVAVGGVIPRI